MKTVPTWKRRAKKAMKHLISKSVGGLPLLITILEKSRDQQAIYITVTIFKVLLLPKAVRHERIRSFISSGALNHLLRIVGSFKQTAASKEDFLSCLYSVIARLGHKDRKFGLKARLCGVLPVILSHIKHFSSRPTVYIPLLITLKGILNSSLNATALCKDGLLTLLVSSVNASKRKMTLSPVYAMEAIAVATRARNVVRHLVQQDELKDILTILDPVHWACAVRKENVKVIRLFRFTLQVLVHVTVIKVGREALCQAHAVPYLLQWAKSLPESGDSWSHLVSLVSLIVQRCLPPTPIPILHLQSPVTFPLPIEKCSLPGSLQDVNATDKKSTSSEKRSNSISSSSHSITESDLEEQGEPFVEQLKLLTDKDAEQLSLFFDEMKLAKSETDLSFLSSKMDGAFSSEDEESNKSCDTLSLTESGDFQLTWHLQESRCRHLNTLRRRRSHINQMQDSLSGDESPKHRIDRTSKNEICRSPTARDRFIAGLSPVRMRDSANLRRNKTGLSPSPVRRLVPILKDDDRIQKLMGSINVMNVYEKIATKTVSVMPFIKLAYPDIKSCEHFKHYNEKLHRIPGKVMRANIIKHAEQMLHGTYSFDEVFNLDNYLNEKITSNIPLSNNDEQRVSSSVKYDRLIFDSRFESGNLRKAFRRDEREYDLIINPDVNTHSHHQWFYFEVFGMQEHVPYVFNILNMEKSNSLFNEGMCPLMFSVRSYMEKKIGWARTGKNICYFRNHFVQSPSVSSMLNEKPYYTLTFTIVFPYTNDVCYFAYHYPYTYTSLQTHLHSWLNTYDVSQIYCKTDELCKTLAGNSVPLLTITALPLKSDRPYIFLTARVHPGESNSSWVMKGTLDFLLSNKSLAQHVRDMYVFKIVPMLNPDGVINGCHRCSLTGQDLNRQWIIPNPKLHPTIYNTKALLHHLSTLGKKPLVFCDYHGHSRRKNVFFYGCNPEHSWWSCDAEKTDRTGFEVLPLLMSAADPSFSLHHCSFAIERSREATARITVWRQFGVTLSYTMECTYGGFDQGMNSGSHIGISHLEDTGMKLCICLGKLNVGPVDAAAAKEFTFLPKARAISSSPCSANDDGQSSTSSQSEDESYESDENDENDL